jgi:putative transposase
MEASRAAIIVWRGWCVIRGLYGVPQRKRWRKKVSGQQPGDVRTQESWLYLCVVVDLYSGIAVGWSISHCQDRQLVLQAVLMALWQREAKTTVILHSDRGCQFTSDEYQRFLQGHNLICSMSAVGSCADNAAAESFFGVLKRERERIYRRQYRTRAEVRTDIFDCIERFHNPRKRRQMKCGNSMI